MTLSQGTSTFLLCFAGFWLVWAFIITACCFCSFVRRRLKRGSEERLREQCLRDLHPPPPHLSPPYRERCPLQFCPPAAHRLSMSSPPPVPPRPLPVQRLPQANWVTLPDMDLSGRPPCYEEALLMDDPPPPYSELLAEPLVLPRTQVLPLLPQHPNPPPPPPPPPPPSDTSKPPPASPGGPRVERGYDSLIALPSLHHGRSSHRDSLGHLLASMDLNRHRHYQHHYHNHQNHQHHQHHQPHQPHQQHQQLLHHGDSPSYLSSTLPHLQEGRTQRDELVLRATVQGKQVIQGLRGLEPGCGLPTAFPLLGRSTAV